MTISSYSTASLATQRATRTFSDLKENLGTYQVQLSTGRVATTYAGLGAGASQSVGLTSSLSRLDTYATNAGDASTRIALMTTSVEAIGTMASDLQPNLANEASGIAPQFATMLADSNLRSSLDALNQNYAGRYLFGGRLTGAAPVASADLILNGDATRAGLKTLVAQRRAADLGTAGTGRLTASASGTTVSLAEQNPAQPFGFKIASVATTGTAITKTYTAGPPASASFALGGQPAVGDAVTATLTLPDGSTQAITVKASASGGTDETFAIGATPAATAANLSAALTASLRTTASTSLVSASTLKTTTDFFAASSSSPPVRVAGPPYDTATATVPGTAANTVVWYTGDDSSEKARDTATVALGDDESVAIGARANEAPFRQILTAFAAVAVSTFDVADTTTSARYNRLAGSVRPLLAQADQTGSLPSLGADLATANAAVTRATDTIANRKSTLNNALDGYTAADPTTVATKLMALQTKLSASYNVTASIAKLSLVDYLG